MTQELKPCPFCGGHEAEVRRDGPKLASYVWCPGCGAEGGVARVGEVNNPAGNWNRRAPDAAREKRMREVAEEMKRVGEGHPPLWATAKNLPDAIRVWAAKLLEGIEAE